MESETTPIKAIKLRNTARRWVLTQDYIYLANGGEFISTNNDHWYTYQPTERHIMIIEKTLYQIKKSMSKTADKIRIPVEDVSFRITEMLPEGPSKIGGFVCGVEDVVFNLTHKYGKHSETPPIVVMALDQFVTLTHINWALDEAEAASNNA